jgi:hypothetical protein
MAPPDASGPRCHFGKKKDIRVPHRSVYYRLPQRPVGAGEPVAVAFPCPCFLPEIIIKQISKIKVHAGIVAVVAGIRKDKQETGQ